MGDGYIVRRGGSENQVQLRVVNGLSQPSNPKENTIWVETNETIDHWHISFYRPSGWNGLVWIELGGTPNLFNVLKKNELEIGVKSCEMFIAGRWVPMNARLFLNGGWIQYSYTRYYIVNGGISLISPNTVRGLSYEYGNIIIPYGDKSHSTHFVKWSASIFPSNMRKLVGSISIPSGLGTDSFRLSYGPKVYNIPYDASSGVKDISINITDLGAPQDLFFSANSGAGGAGGTIKINDLYLE